MALAGVNNCWVEAEVVAGVETARASLLVLEVLLLQLLLEGVAAAVAVIMPVTAGLVIACWLEGITEVALLFSAKFVAPWKPRPAYSTIPHIC